ncbi:hypothetical protein JCM14467A_05420 [Vulcanisaeta sp. JCM 14467]
MAYPSPITCKVFIIPDKVIDWRTNVIISDRLAMARNYVNVLRSIRSSVRNVDDLSRDLIIRGAVERYLHLAVESLIDVGMRLCSILNLGKPERYRDVARIMVNAGIFDSEIGRLFEMWIGFMNVLVHGYAVIDPERLFEALNEVDELDKVIDKISDFVRGRSIDPGGNQSVALNNKELVNLVNAVRQVLEGFDYVLFAYVFGSRVTGRASPGSDVDVAVFTSRDLSWKEFVGLMHALEDSLGLGVDLVHLNRASLLLAYEVVSKGVPVLDRDVDRRVEFEVRTIKEFLDFKPRLLEYYNAVLKH